MDRLESMAVFIKVADCGSLAAAARALDISAQMVGKHLVFLENRLGARLLNRTTRRQSLTEIGTVFYQRCKIVLAEAELAEAVTRQLSVEPRGTLRITAPVSFGAYALTPMINRYQRAYPQVRVDLTLTDRITDVVDEGYEAVIRIGTLKDSSLIARELAPYRLLACASPGYLARKGTPEQVSDLSHHDCLGYRYWSRPSVREWRFSKQGKEQSIAIDSQLQINDISALLTAALNDGGIILGAEVVMRPYLACGQLLRVLPEYESPSRPLHILFPAHHYLTPKLRSFVDYVVMEFGPQTVTDHTR